MIVNASCTFLEPLVYPGDIEVRMYLGDPGRTSVGSYYEIWMNGRKYAEGAAKMVWIDLASGRRRRCRNRLRRRWARKSAWRRPARADDADRTRRTTPEGTP